MTDKPERVIGTDHPEYIATYSFECSVTHRIYHVTMQGPFFAACREAKELAAAQMLKTAEREEPHNKVTVDACRARCRDLHSGIKPGRVHVIDIWKGQLRSQVR